MDGKQTQIVFVVYALIVLCWLAGPTVGNVNEPVWIIPQFDLLFDANHAFKVIQEYVVQYPRRVLGSVESRQSTGYLKQYLTDLGYQVSYTQFDARIQGRGQVGRNVLGYKAGKISEILAVVAHYDTAPTTYQGAMANGSGVGVMLEAARIFSSLPTQRSLLFIATDGTEWGQLGARDIVQYYPERGHIVAVLSLDNVGIGELAGFSLDPAGQSGGYTPPWLREISRTAGEAEGLPITGPYGFREHLDRALLISWTDQGPFLNAGIPAINLAGISRDAARARAIYHSANDTIENLAAASIAKYGRVAERIVRTLDDLAVIPKESMGSFRLRDMVYLSPEAMSFLDYVSFLPLILILVIHLKNHRKAITIGRIEREVLAYVCTSLPFLLVYYPIGLFRLLRILPRYSLYPATPKDPVLENPAWGVIWGILALGFAVAVGLYFLVLYLRRKLPQPDFYVSKIILLFIFLVTIILALQHSTYWAMTFLFLPACVWGAVGPGRGTGGRLLHWVWIIAAGIFYYLFVVGLATYVGVGWKFFWYEVLALSTGLFTPAGYMLSAVTAAVGIRFLAIQFHGTNSEGSAEPGQSVPAGGLV